MEGSKLEIVPLSTMAPNAQVHRLWNLQATNA